ncbi:VOC family protein [Bdellovibrio reynosensis]|uniref:VOC family protein n=1 Tax=Bdellovibrio reynosensis TaxID=2835041 RepID=A0ABY4CAF8_9BACT|nr:VOC family protein [Bdellovibrio reynosensis]UOF00671.1 VOC family protein [Bdellovibrio reynosensis]
MATVKPVPIPEAPLAPYLCVRNAAQAIEFYQKAFGAKVIFRMDDPSGSGKIGHAELKIENAHIYLCDEFPEMDTRGPESIGGSPVMLHLYVKDVDAFTERAVKAGITVDRRVENQIYGDRGGKFIDPFGHIWWIASHKEDVSAEEVTRRAKKMMAQQQQQDQQ